MDLSLDDKLSLLEMSPDVTLDTEGMDYMMGMSFAVDGLDHGFYLPVAHELGKNLSPSQQDKLRHIISTRERISFHNAMHDLLVLEKAGFPYLGFFWDTMLMAHWINEEMFAYDLSTVSTHYGFPPKAMPQEMRDVLSEAGWDAVPINWMDLYSSNDSYITHRSERKMEPIFLDQFPISLWEREQEFIRRVILPMRKRGIMIDIGFCVKEYFRGTAIMAECKKQLGFNPNSPKALEKFLIEDMGLPVVAHTKACIKCHKLNMPVHTHTARPSFDKHAMEEYDAMLEKMDDKRAQTILRYKGWMKTTSSNYKSYMDKVDDKAVLHPSYNLHRTVTSRLSCSDPNLQQIPKAGKKEWNGELKKAFIPRPGYVLWTADYSQLQFRMTVAMAVAYCGEPMELLEIFNDPKRDIFAEMAKQMGWLRDDVKTLVYLILFGGGGKRAGISFNVSKEQGAELVNEFHLTYPGIKKLSKAAEQAARRQGYVALWTGRRRHFPKGSAFYRALNASIQGGEAEIIKSAMIQIAKEVCDDNCHIILQIHDEIVFEIKEGMEQDYLPRIQKIMVDACQKFNEHTGVDMLFKTSVGKWGEK